MPHTKQFERLMAALRLCCKPGRLLCAKNLTRFSMGRGWCLTRVRCELLVKMRTFLWMVNLHFYGAILSCCRGLVGFFSFVFFWGLGDAFG